MTKKNESSFVAKPIPELVKALCSHALPGSQAHEEIKGALYAALTKRLSESIDKHERASLKLSNRILWLNIILGIFTIVGTVLAIYSFIK